jgi:D-sedoheptulose 7-phosphate isomerase
MERRVRDYYLQIDQLLHSVMVTGGVQDELEFCEGVCKAVRLIEVQSASGGKLMFIGNGASAAISSHQATDFWKNAGIRAMAFNDIAGLTCVSNDYGYEYVFEKPVSMFADPSDVLVAISSSGQSENILRGVSAAVAKGVNIITLSGFDRTNPLRSMGCVNFYVPSSHYGHVEVTHLSICHCMLDVSVQNQRLDADEADDVPLRIEQTRGARSGVLIETSSRNCE